MSHSNVKRDLGTTPHWDEMEPCEYYQLRGWSAIMLNDTLDEGVYIDLYSYDAHILRYYVRENHFHACKYERPYDVSATTSRHIYEFMRFINTAIDYEGNRFDLLNSTHDYPLTHTKGEWCFRGWSGDYDEKPFWW